MKKIVEAVSYSLAAIDFIFLFISAAFALGTGLQMNGLLFFILSICSLIFWSRGLVYAITSKAKGEIFVFCFLLFIWFAFFMGYSIAYLQSVYII